MNIPQTSTTSNRSSPSTVDPRFEELTDETVELILDSRRRRGVIRCILAADGSVPIRKLVRTLSESENDPTLETTFLERCQRVHDSLTSTHLPKLEAYEIVEYERGAGLVSPASRLVELEPYV